jgi:hypothetical protein
VSNRGYPSLQVEVAGDEAKSEWAVKSNSSNSGASVVLTVKLSIGGGSDGDEEVKRACVSNVCL